MTPSLRDCISTLRGRRPIGLGHLGAGSRIERPARLDGRPAIFIGDRVQIRAHAWISAIASWNDQRFKPRIEIESNVYIGHHCCIAAVGELRIGARSVLSEHVYIGDSAHGITPGEIGIMNQPLKTKGAITIGPDCFIGYGARLLPGSRLGCWSVVATNAVVNSDVPAFTMVAGAPARPIRRYQMATQSWEPISQIDQGKVV